jgi:hypothetical protein
LKVQGPAGLAMMAIRGNKPFKMEPLDRALSKLYSAVPAPVYGAIASGAYAACRGQCDIDCPYPGGNDPEAPCHMDELDTVDANDQQALFNNLRSQSGGGGAPPRGSIRDALGELFRMG